MTDDTLDDEDEEIKGLREWIGITKRKKKTAAEKLRSLKRFTDRLIEINADLSEEVKRLKQRVVDLEAGRS
jgi:ribosome-associated translation inhibitor RaiA